jgi:predicted amidohydrolase
MIAAAQGGAHEDGRVTYGHSMIVDPWGRVLAEGTEEPGVMLATIDPSVVAAVRARIPSLQHTRQFRLGHARLAPAAQAAE